MTRPQVIAWSLEPGEIWVRMHGGWAVNRGRDRRYRGRIPPAGAMR